jgi:hypothetical protein
MRLPNRLRVFLSGGSGNQLFQISAARLYAEAHDLELVFDPSWTSVTRHADNTEVLTHVALCANETISRSRWFGLSALELVLSERVLGNTWSLNRNGRITKHGNDIDRIIDIQGIRALAGVFADPSTHRRLRATGKNILMNWPRVIEPWMTEGYVAIHIRGGDYFKLGAAFGVLSSNYYEEALKLVPAHLHHVWVTNDLGYARAIVNRFPERSSSVFGPQDLSAVNALRVLSQAEYVVASNSTYSWWGAELSEKPQVKIGPSTYSPATRTNWMVDESWITAEADWFG